MTALADEIGMQVEGTRAAQQAWAQTPMRKRLRLVRRLRAHIAEHAAALAETVPLDLPGSLHRTVPDTLVAEVLPLAEACRFLEREAEFILAPRRESTSARPLWLSGVEVEVVHQSLGVVLIIAPANYPLLLPGVQALQALAAGNAVRWKPAPGCSAPALAVRAALIHCGLDPLLIEVLDESSEAAIAAIAERPDKVFLTGSDATGRAVMRQCADTLFPVTMELSGCDAVFVLEGADLARVTEAIAFGLRLNGSATCMAPRRLFASEGVAKHLIPLLKKALSGLAPVPLPPQTIGRIASLIEDAQLLGATIVTGAMQEPDGLRPILIERATPDMQAAQQDIFAPILSIFQTTDEEEALGLYSRCPCSLTAAVFGPERPAERLARRIHAGVVLVNDLIVPTADPRVPFGGSGSSGFGRTRGREGLLEMTATKAIVVQRSKSLLAYRPTTPAHAVFFAACTRVLHAAGLRVRLSGLRDAIAAAKNIKR